MPNIDEGGVDRRSILKFAGLAAGAVAMPGLLSACGSSSSSSSSKPKELVVAGGGGALIDAYRQAYYEPFTKKTGIRIIETSNEAAKLKSMVEFGNVTWDVAQLDAAFSAAPAGEAGLLEPLDYNVINTDGVDSKLVKKFYLPCDVAALCLAWNDKGLPGGRKPASWADYLNLGQFPGPRGLFKDPHQTLEVILLGDGVPANQLYPLDLARAFRALDKVKGQLSWWSTGAESVAQLVNGEVNLSCSWNGRLQGPVDTGAPIGYTFSESLLVCDSWVVPKGAKNKQASMEFIAFCMDPKNQARLSGFIPYGPTNSKAMDLVDAKTRAKLPNGGAGYAAFQDFDWWAKNGDGVVKAWNNWIGA